MFFLQQRTINYLHISKQRFLVVKYCVVDMSVCTNFVFALFQFAISYDENLCFVSEVMHC